MQKHRGVPLGGLDFTLSTVDLFDEALDVFLDFKSHGTMDEAMVFADEVCQKYGNPGGKL